MHDQSPPEQRRRNRNFDETHRLLVEKAVELISAFGPEALSIAALARESGINRSTVYYHFESREDLIEAVKAWSARKMTDCFLTEGDADQQVIESTRFVLANPEVAKLWFDEFISGGDISTLYPMWDQLVTLVAEVIAARGGAGPAPAPEALSAVLLAGLLVGARVFHNSIRPGIPLAEAVAQFARAHTWLLRESGII